MMQRAKLNHIVYVSFFISLFFVFNIKSFILVFIGLGVILFFLENSLRRIFTLLFLLALPFEKGIRGWMIEVVNRGAELWQRNYEIYFGISLKLIFGITLIGILMRRKKKIKQFFSKNNYTFLTLTLFYTFTLLSTYFAFRFNIAVIGNIRLLLSILYFFIPLFIFKTREDFTLFKKYIISLAFFFGLIGTIQFIKQQPLGIFLEDQPDVARFGWVTNESDFLFRVSGLIGHPTFFGSFISMLFPISFFMMISEYLKKNKNKFIIGFYSLTNLLLLVSIFGTYSRSAWIALLLSPIFLIYTFKEKINLKKLNHIHTYFFMITVVVFIFFNFSLLQLRLGSFKNIWTYGSGRGRLILIEESFKMIKKYPLLGVGFNHFTYYMVQEPLTPEKRGFLYPVHNTFLLFFSELGILAGILFIVFVITILSVTYKKIKGDFFVMGIYVGCITFLINSQFHTLFGQDPSFELFMLLLGYLLII